MTKKGEAKEEKRIQTREKHSGHGSITKAGKVRMNTPQIPKTNLKKRKGPRMQNRAEAKKLQQRIRESAEKDVANATGMM